MTVCVSPMSPCSATYTSASVPEPRMSLVDTVVWPRVRRQGLVIETAEVSACMSGGEKSVRACLVGKKVGAYMFGGEQPVHACLVGKSIAEETQDTIQYRKCTALHPMSGTKKCGTWFSAKQPYLGMCSTPCGPCRCWREACVRLRHRPRACQTTP